MPLRCLPLLLSLLLPEALAATGQPAAAAAGSAGPRFRIVGAVVPVRQDPAAGARFQVAPLPSGQQGATPPDPIFADGFE